MQIKIAGLVEDSIVDGPGMRLTVFFQGCPHKCEGCHNPQTHDFYGGTEMDTAEVLDKLRRNPLLSGITLSGGEPFAQPETAYELARGAKEQGKSVWVYSGYTYEQLLQQDAARRVLEVCDVLVDGPFILAQKTLNLKWRGSWNQRVIELKRGKDNG